MSSPSSRAPRHPQHPLLIAAAVAVIVFCGAGTAAILGWIPSSIGGTPARAELSESERAMLASALQDGAPRTLAALDAPGAGSAPQRPPLQESERAAPDELPPPAPVQAARKAVPAARHVAAEPARARWCAHCGNIESVREVSQRAQGSGLGAAGGAVLGGLLGNQVGGGNGRKLATVAGAVGGAVVGNQVEGNLKATRSYEIRVRLDDGGARTFHQQSAAGWRVGDRVKVVDGTLRSAV
ncbi:glycine zipper 2TM domain-containing protein [Massilia atriviolacea]|uniref:Glycine zipper 2TM domain-containing protein n=1 Tax=Massilia atriviolacea TaxID=2495579 RepID=A0A430HIQ1_9BURK|nr:glycine zipper 2TM domain-containing protein [Massilia atriviolacea]RSZ57385.1 glycine zipper 2TM domain-containing protein [Massilia atriviolacea]